MIPWHRDYLSVVVLNLVIIITLNIFTDFIPISRPFLLTRAIAHARVSTHANLTACAICRTHEKSYSAEKVLFHWIFLFQSFVFVYERHLWIMRYMSIAYRRCWLQQVLFGFFVSVFSFVLFLEPPKLILCTILNVKFLPFVQINYNELWKKLNCSCHILLWWRISLWLRHLCESHAQNRSHMRFTARMLFCSRKGLL